MPSGEYIPHLDIFTTYTGEEIAIAGEMKMNVSYINYKGQPVYYQLNSNGKWLMRLDLDLEVDKG